MQLYSRVRGVQLQIEGRGLHCLLFLASEFGETVRKGVGYSKVHLLFDLYRNTDLIRYWRVQINVKLSCVNGNNQSVPRSFVVPFKSGARSPPSEGWIDPENATTCEISSFSAPDVLVD
jgi:hypothetical protein